VPDQYAGPMTFQPMVFAGTQDLAGPEVTIAIKPLDEPKSVALVNRFYAMAPEPGQVEQLYLRGSYGGGVERDLTSGVTGTEYSSSDSSVAAVDANGRVRIGRAGVAVITAQNGSARDFASFVVEDPANPLPPQDLSDRLEIKREQLGREAESIGSSKVTERVIVTNPGATPIVGRLYLLLMGLPRDVVTFGGRTRTIVPLGTPYAWLKLEPDGLTLPPGAATSAKFEFFVRPDQRVDYTPRVFRCAGDP
jgi:hypothetical protein